MGRYAYFNTGFKRPFTFAVQSSGEMQLFGGVDRTTAADAARESFRHEWEASRDSEVVMSRLRPYTTDSPLGVPDFAEFEGSLAGTQELRIRLWALEKQYKATMGQADFSTFELGCCIYHQLTYTPVLTVRYEIL